MYVVPLELQFYNGFYNKDLFAKAGITTLPTNWQEFMAAASKLKAAGIQPMVYGSGAQAILPSFYPWYDFSYMMMMMPVADWQKLYTGELPFTDPKIVATVQQWIDLYKSLYTNKDVLSNADSWKQFLAGKAAMTLEGTWGISDAEKQLGSKVGVFLPPFTDQALNGVVQFPGDGFAMTSYCQHKDVAADFLKLHDDHGRPEDHLRRGPHSGAQGSDHERPAQPGSPELRGDQELRGLPDGRQHPPARGRRHRQQDVAGGLRRDDVRGGRPQEACRTR